MRRAVLTIGPQYAGKSTFCKNVLTKCPGLSYVSRDAILVALFGSAWLDPYTGGHHIAEERMWEEVAEVLARPGAFLLLDAWNGGSHERADIIARLHGRGADRVEGWYFTTPLNQCQQWRALRERQEREEEESDARWRRIFEEQQAFSYAYAYEDFHDQRIMEEDGFDRILRINPLIVEPDNQFLAWAQL